MSVKDENDENERFPRGVFFLVLAGLVALVSMLGPHEGSIWRLPQVLEERAATALLASNLGGLTVTSDGQSLRLSGIVENERDINRARQVALTSSGSGGVWAGGVTGIDASGVSVGVFERPYSWSARREDGRVVLSGAVPSETAKTEIANAARRAFTDAEIVDTMHVAGGAPSPDFAAVAREAVRLLAGLHGGEARIVDEQIVFIGDGSQASVDALSAVFEAPPAPFRSRIDVSVEGRELANPELQGLNLTNANAETCERAFDRLMEGNVINFESGSATIDLASRPVLDTLASVALRCDRFMIEVAGHTDNQGGREFNMELSQRRADAVAEYLASQGVGPSRLNARGYGADRPRASNATPDGQAANRRIEFYVSS